MIERKTWRSVTCRCVLDVDVETGGTVTGTVHRVKRCGVHHRLDDAAVLAAVVADSFLVRDAARAALMVPGLSRTREDGSITFREGLVFAWRFNQARELEVDLHGATDDQAAQANSLLTVALGVTRARVRGRRG